MILEAMYTKSFQERKSNSTIFQANEAISYFLTSIIAKRQPTSTDPRAHKLHHTVKKLIITISPTNEFKYKHCYLITELFEKYYRG